MGWVGFGTEVLMFPFLGKNQKKSPLSFKMSGLAISPLAV